MFVGFVVAVNPGVEFALANGKSADELVAWGASLIVPCLGKVNDGVSGIMGNPKAG